MTRTVGKGKEFCRCLEENSIAPHRIPKAAGWVVVESGKSILGCDILARQQRRGRTKHVPENVSWRGPGLFPDIIGQRGFCAGLYRSSHHPCRSADRACEFDALRPHDGG